MPIDKVLYLIISTISPTTFLRALMSMKIYSPTIVFGNSVRLTSVLFLQKKRLLWVLRGRCCVLQALLGICVANNRMRCMTNSNYTDRGVPVIAIATDGKVRELAHAAFVAEVYVDGAGDERLVVDAHVDGQYQVLAYGPGGADPTVIHTAHVINPTYAAPRFSLRFTGNGNETPGWVPVLPGGQPLHDAGTDIEEFRGMGRFLVSLDGGPTVDLGPEPEVQPAPDEPARADR
jgi:hypothetical protein